MTYKKPIPYRVDALPATGVVGGIYFVKSEKKVYLCTESGWEPYNNADEATHATNADNAAKATTATKVTNKLTAGAKSYDGSAAVSLTKADLGLGNVDNTADKDKKVYEANLQWGGRNIVSTISPVDSAFVPELSANRLGFFDVNRIGVEYSIDGGETWVDYEATDVYKKQLVTQDLGVSYLYPGNKHTAEERNINNQLKISFFDFDVKPAFYSYFRKFIIKMGTNGCLNCWVTLRKNTKENPDVFTDVVTKQLLSGWPGWNVLNFPPLAVYNNSPKTQCSRLEFIFGYDEISTATGTGMCIYKIYGFSENFYAGIEYQRTGSIYTVDANKGVSFPASLNGATIYEGGTALSQKYAPKSIETTVNNKVDKVANKQLSTNDYTTAEKNKLAGLSNAEALTNDEIDNAIK